MLVPVVEHTAPEAPLGSKELHSTQPLTSVPVVAVRSLGGRVLEEPALARGRGRRCAGCRATWPVASNWLTFTRSASVNRLAS